MKRAKGRRQGTSERHAMAKLVQEGQTDLIAAVQRGELLPSQALNRDRQAKRKAREGNHDDD